MKLHVHFQVGQVTVNEVVEGTTADAVVGQMQQRFAQEAGVLIGGLVRRMSPLQFAREATKRYNAAANDNAPMPNSCEEFLRLGVTKNFATVLEA